MGEIRTDDAATADGADMADGAATAGDAVEARALSGLDTVPREIGPREIGPREAGPADGGRGMPDELGTRQRAPKTRIGSALSLLRWAWYSLTSMRTALVLLFLLALASVPGSILPQRGGSEAGKVAEYYLAHPTIAPILDHLGLFNVFGSVWFAAIYLLLFISLAGCVLPRSRRHLGAMRARPPASPRNFARLPKSTSWTTGKAPAETLACARQVLRSKRFRADLGELSVNAEKGYLRETGNLVFHMSLLVVLLGVAITAGFGFTGSALIKEHNGFTDTVIDYDDISHGRFVDVANLPPFSFTLNNFEATYHRGDNARGDADTFNAHVTWQPNLQAAPRKTDIQVNHPLSTQGTNVYLGGHGYAPHFIITDGKGRTFDQTVPFLPQKGTYQYQGVVKLPDARPSQLGITGFFLPTASTDPKTGQPISVFPAPDNPAVVIGVFSGDLGLDNGVPQSVYALDTSKMKRLLTTVMTPGQTVTLPDGLGTITFAGFDQWAAFNITHDPGKQVVLVAVCAMVAGLLLSLGVRRRRLWVRATADPAGRTLVEVGGLTRSDAHGGFDEEFARLVTALQAGIPPDGPTPKDADGADGEGLDDAVATATGAATTQAQRL